CLVFRRFRFRSLCEWPLSFELNATTVSNFFFSSRRRHTSSVSAFLLNRSSDLQATTNQNVKKRPACSELRWAYCNHKATYFASYLTGGDCVPDDQDRKSVV